jgi:hypothetical protein
VPVSVSSTVIEGLFETENEGVSVREEERCAVRLSDRVWEGVLVNESDAVAMTDLEADRLTVRDVEGDSVRDTLMVEVADSMGVCEGVTDSVALRLNDEVSDSDPVVVGDRDRVEALPVRDSVGDMVTDGVFEPVNDLEYVFALDDERDNEILDVFERESVKLGDRVTDLEKLRDISSEAEDVRDGDRSSLELVVLVDEFV